MKKLIHPVLALCMLSIAACNKHDTILPVPPLDSTAIHRDIDINLNYDDNYDSLHTDMWEVIVTDPAGKPLFDSAAHANTNISAVLHAHTLLVDLTFVYYSGVYDNYTAVTYRNVDPSAWSGAPVPGTIFGIGVDIQTSTIATVSYTHPPTLHSLNSNNSFSVMISDYVGGTGERDLNYTPAYAAYQPGGLLTAGYDKYGNGPVYTWFSQLGLYNIHQPPASGNDTVDLSHMDTAAMVNYSVPAGYTKSQCMLYGFTDTTNLDKSMTLSINFYDWPMPADLEFPPKGFQTYNLLMDTYNSATNEFLTCSTYGPTIPSTIHWLTAADLTINAKLQDSFSVSFSNTKPTFYRMDYKSGSNYFEIYSAPDGAPLHPYTWFSHLGSKLLQGQSLSSMAPYYLFLEQGEGFGGYNGLMTWYAKSPFTNRYPSGIVITTYQTPL